MIATVAGRLRRRGIRDGLVGGNRRWLTIWLVIVAAQTAHKLAKPKPAVETLRLEPGESVCITDLGVADPEP